MTLRCTHNGSPPLRSELDLGSLPGRRATQDRAKALVGECPAASADCPRPKVDADESLRAVRRLTGTSGHQAGRNEGLPLHLWL